MAIQRDQCFVRIMRHKSIKALMTFGLIALCVAILAISGSANASPIVKMSVNYQEMAEDNTNIPSPTVVVTPVTTPTATAAATPAATMTGTEVAGAGTMTPTTLPDTEKAEIARDVSIVEYGTDRSTYQRGDTAKGFIVIKNDGTKTINELGVSPIVAIEAPVIGSATFSLQDYAITDLNIKPGETKRVEFAMEIPSEYKGVSTAGTYDLTLDVFANNKKVDTVSKEITVK